MSISQGEIYYYNIFTTNVCHSQYPRWPPYRSQILKMACLLAGLQFVVNTRLFSKELIHANTVLVSNVDRPQNAIWPPYSQWNWRPTQFKHLYNISPWAGRVHRAQPPPLTPTPQNLQEWYHFVQGISLIEN